MKSKKQRKPRQKPLEVLFEGTTFDLRKLGRVVKEGLVIGAIYDGRFQIIAVYPDEDMSSRGMHYLFLKHLRAAVEASLRDPQYKKRKSGNKRTKKKNPAR